MGQATRQSRRKRTVLAAILLCPAAALAQPIAARHALATVPALASDLSQTSAPPASPTSVAEALQQVAQEASVVCTGSVLAVEADKSGGAMVKLAVEQAVRGVASGSTYTMHISAWAGGVERYYPGERALFLLTAPSAAGYSAPVMGERGVVPLSGDRLVGKLDLRWIAADVPRTASLVAVAQPAETAAGQRPVRKEGARAAQSAATRRSHASDSNGTGEASAASLPDVGAIDRDLVLDMLRMGTFSEAAR